MSIKSEIKLFLYEKWFVRKAVKRIPFINQETVKDIDVEKFSGLWYEIANYGHKNNPRLHNTTINHIMQPDGEYQYKTVLSGRNEKGRHFVSEGKSYFEKEAERCFLKIFHAFLFTTKYWIYELGENYEYALVGVSGTNNYLWILSRTPHMKSEDLEFLKDRIYYRGYDPDKLVMVDQI